MRLLLVIAILAAPFSAGLTVGKGALGTCCVTAGEVSQDQGCCCGTRHETASTQSCCQIPSDNQQPVKQGSSDDGQSCPSDGSCPCAPLGCGCQPAHVVAALLPAQELETVGVEFLTPAGDESLNSRCDLPALPPPKCLS